MTANLPSGQNKYITPIKMVGGSNGYWWMGFTQRLNSFYNIPASSLNNSIQFDINESYFYLNSQRINYFTAGVLEVGDILHMAIDMDEGKVSFGINEFNDLEFISDPMFKYGTWYPTIVFYDPGKTAELVLPKDGCQNR